MSPGATVTYIVNNTLTKSENSLRRREAGSITGTNYQKPHFETEDIHLTVLTLSIALTLSICSQF